MRIVGETEKEGIKITLFQMNGKISVKLEKNLLEQTYKFRDGSRINNPDDAYKLIDNDFIRTALDIFALMSGNRTNGLEKMHSQTLDEFEEII
jgi:hypothetical protein